MTHTSARAPDNDGFFIDEHRRVVLGEEAARLVEEKGEQRFLDTDRGVVLVSNQRWQEAQRYEARTWMQAGRFAVDDRNDHHSARFAGYGALRGAHFARAIELGCGPFTNMRIILGKCAIDELSLLDPLAETYLRHHFCAYSGGRIGGLLRLKPLVRALRRPRRLFREWLETYHAGGWLGQTVTLHNCPIESFKPVVAYDLVVMINVLEHCRDAGAVLDQVLSMISPGGVFVFADVAWDPDEVRRSMSLAYDAGHPLRIAESVIRSFLSEHFVRLMEDVRSTAVAAGSLTLHKREIYFIGSRKRRATA